MKIRNLLLPIALASFVAACVTPTDEVAETPSDAEQSDATEDEDGEQGKGRPPGR